MGVPPVRCIVKAGGTPHNNYPQIMQRLCLVLHNCRMIVIVLWDGRPARPVYCQSRRDTPQYCSMILIVLWDGRPARPVYCQSRRDTPQQSSSNCATPLFGVAQFEDDFDCFVGWASRPSGVLS